MASHAEGPCRGPDGRPVTAFYPMTQLPDGSWRINGCYLQAPDEHQA